MKLFNRLIPFTLYLLNDIFILAYENYFSTCNKVTNISTKFITNFFFKNSFHFVPFLLNYYYFFL